MDFLSKTLQKEVEDIIQSRVKQWASYYFEKELLPSLVNEVQSRVSVKLISNSDKNEMSVEIKLKPKVN